MKVSGLGGQASYYAFCGRRRLNTFDGDDAFWHFTPSGGRHSQDSEIGPSSLVNQLNLTIHHTWQSTFQLVYYGSSSKK